MSNSWITYPEDGDNGGKLPLIPNKTTGIRISSKRIPLQEGSNSYQLVGEVMAHQDYDGYLV